MKRRRYRFKEGDKVRICAGERASIRAQEHDGEIVTIKDRCSFDYAYHLEELPDLWADGLFEEADK